MSTWDTSRDVENVNDFALNFLTDEVTVYFHMLGTIMMDQILHNLDGSLVIT